MTTKLEIYQAACRLIGTSVLASLTAGDASRIEFDKVYDDSVQEFLEKGLWKPALRSSMLEADEDADIEFGPSYKFDKPDDFVRLAGIATDGDFRNEVMDYVDENDRWYSNQDTIYIRYVSNGLAYGRDLTKWRQTMAKACASILALNTTLTISKDRGDRNDLLAISARLLSEAKRLDAVDERVKVTGQGRLVRSRRGWGVLGIRNGRLIV